MGLFRMRKLAPARNSRVRRAPPRGFGDAYRECRYRTWTWRFGGRRWFFDRQPGNRPLAGVLMAILQAQVLGSPDRRRSSHNYRHDLTTAATKEPSHALLIPQV